jgi:hypothetical protein
MNTTLVKNNFLKKDLNKYQVKKGFQISDQRTGHSCVLYNSHIYLFGGRKGKNYVSDLNIFDFRFFIFFLNFQKIKNGKNIQQRIN